MFLCGVANVVVPSNVLITSVVVFIVIPLAAGYITRTSLLKAQGVAWFNSRFLPKFHPVTVVALLVTLVLIFAFQADNLLTKWTAVLLIMVPILIQVYFNSTLTYMLMRVFHVPHNVASPGALIGASNFFELAVAVAITLFGPSSGAALACVVGVLVEVPVMLSVCNICNRSRIWCDKDRQWRAWRRGVRSRSEPSRRLIHQRQLMRSAAAKHSRCRKNNDTANNQ